MCWKTSNFNIHVRDGSPNQEGWGGVYDASIRCFRTLQRVGRVGFERRTRNRSNRGHVSPRVSPRPPSFRTLGWEYTYRSALPTTPRDPLQCEWTRKASERVGVNFTLVDCVLILAGYYHAHLHPRSMTSNGWMDEPSPGLRMTLHVMSYVRAHICLASSCARSI
jgi:hypothetical protein